MRDLIENMYALMEMKLPEDPWKYFKKAPGYKMVPVAKLNTTRARPKGIKNAEKYMKLAYDGEMDRRKPISVTKMPDGSFRVNDGNSTTAIAKKNGWKQIPAMVEAKVQESADGSRFLAKKYGLTAKEAKKLASHPDQKGLIRKVERWRDQHGVAPASPQARGMLLTLLSEEQLPLFPGIKVPVRLSRSKPKKGLAMPRQARMANVQTFIDMLKVKILKYDKAAMIRGLKPGGYDNIYALGHYFGALEKVEKDVHHYHLVGSDEAMDALTKSLKRRYDPKFPPVAYVLKKIAKFKKDGKAVKYR
jgi:hypothetical protein